MAPHEKRIVIYNHKGGVGKTTLTVNIAAAFVSLGKRVLLVDSDPQCNLTAYSIESNVVDDLLDTSDDDKKGRTVWSAVKPVCEGTGMAKGIAPYELSTNLFLLPGDIRLSEFELSLSTLWSECVQRRIRGFRGVTALSGLVSTIAQNLAIDYVFYDAGPNIGPLNKVILLDCDEFIVPAACDLFSVRALKTLGQTLAGWVKDWEIVTALAPDDVYLFKGRPRFLGYIPQRFRVYRGEPSSGYSSFLSKLERNVDSEIIAVMRKIDATLAPSRVSETMLGQIQDFGALANAAQAEGVPLWSVRSIGSKSQKEQAKQVFIDLSRQIIKRAQLA
ncbi:MAG: AAA family ATPase [Nitrospira sp.]|nr:AAA family ATPase [Nitrospira sp.]